MAGPEVAEGVHDGHQGFLELIRLGRKGSSVPVWLLLHFELADHPSVGRLSLEDGLVDLVSGPGSPQPEYVRVVEMGQPADLHVEPAEAVAQQLSGVSVQDQPGCAWNRG
jgi:hypothetical protein